MAWLSLWMAGTTAAQTELATALETNQHDLRTGGRAFLLEEARRASFFLLGELHGDNEIPTLLENLWPALWQGGYRHVAAEVSPWAAGMLEFRPSKLPSAGGHGLWRQREVETVTKLKSGHAAVLWGCDIEEAAPGHLARELAAANKGNRALAAMDQKVQDGYQRKEAAELLLLAREVPASGKLAAPSAKLLTLLIDTLEVESARADSKTRLQASMLREAAMKRNFIENVSRARDAKVMARFGRNHLHRGLDRRGVSTLGNFIAEYAVLKGQSTFHLAAFAAGGKIRWAGSLHDADETSDDPGFALLASAAKFQETVFDLRPLRRILHAIPESKRSAAEASLVYWADSFDAILCYRSVSPLP